jgi:hypothetical protein
MVVFITTAVRTPNPTYEKDNQNSIPERQDCSLRPRVTPGLLSNGYGVFFFFFYVSKLNGARRRPLTPHLVAMLRMLGTHLNPTYVFTAWWGEWQICISFLEICSSNTKCLIYDNSQYTLSPQWKNMKMSIYPCYCWETEEYEAEVRNTSRQNYYKKDQELLCNRALRTITGSEREEL